VPDDDSDLEMVSTGEESASRQSRPPDWWRIAVLLCVFVTALGAVVIAYHEVEQTRYARQRHCVETAFAKMNDSQVRSISGVSALDSQRRCYGLPLRPSTTTFAP
jgi:maltodextrin utilization protein YvdJ